MDGDVDSSHKRRVFVSHSSKDKAFVRKLVEKLRAVEELDVWFDEQSIGIGDSIPSEIESALQDADYVIAVLSPNSIDSTWVQRELDATIMSEDALILPVLIDDCEIPSLLKARKYADFRKPEYFSSALAELVAALLEEQEQLPTAQFQPTSDCVTQLREMKRGDLRRWVIKNLSRSQVGTVWRDYISPPMEDDYPNATFSECVSHFISKMIAADQLEDLLEEVCKEVNP